MKVYFINTTNRNFRKHFKILYQNNQHENKTMMFKINKNKTKQNNSLTAQSFKTGFTNLLSVWIVPCCQLFVDKNAFCLLLRWPISFPNSEKKNKKKKVNTLYFNHTSCCIHL